LIVVLPFLASIGAPRRERRRQRLRARRLVVPALVYLLGVLTFGAPFVARGFDHLEETTSRVNEKLVFHNEARLAPASGLAREPLWVGLAAPRAADALPLPIAFEKTPLSVRVLRDGFWPRVLWRQLEVTLSVLTFRYDASSLYTFAME